MLTALTDKFLLAFNAYFPVLFIIFSQQNVLWLNIMCILDWILKQRKYSSGKTNEIQIVYSLIKNIVLVLTNVLCHFDVTLDVTLGEAM